MSMGKNLDANPVGKSLLRNILSPRLTSDSHTLVFGTQLVFDLTWSRNKKAWQIRSAQPSRSMRPRLGGSSALTAPAVSVLPGSFMPTIKEDTKDNNKQFTEKRPVTSANVSRERVSSTQQPAQTLAYATYMAFYPIVSFLLSETGKPGSKSKAEQVAMELAALLTANEYLTTDYQDSASSLPVKSKK